MTWKISKNVLLSIMELSKAAYPNEFSGLLVGVPDTKTITDIYIIPLTINTPTSSIMRPSFIPLSLSIIGSVHSHPSFSSKASFADLNFFQSKHINIISRYPYGFSDFTVYDSKGEEIKLSVLE